MLKLQLQLQCYSLEINFWQSDYDDLMKIKNKVHDLIENNNKQLTTNSQIFKTVPQII